MPILLNELGLLDDWEDYLFESCDGSGVIEGLVTERYGSERFLAHWEAAITE